MQNFKRIRGASTMAPLGFLQNFANVKALSLSENKYIQMCREMSGGFADIASLAQTTL